jgi:hypothetical protein
LLPRLKPARLIILIREVYYEEIHQDNIRSYPGSGDDAAYEMPGEMHLLPYL